MRNHITAVAVLQIVLGVFGLLGAALMFLVVLGSGFLAGDLRSMALTSVVAVVAAGYLVVISLPGIVGGLGLLAGKSWARLLLLVVAAFELIHVPLGTLLAGYTFWVLLSDRGKRALSTV